jgi:putative hydrolase of the HAD superfamily
MTSAVQFLYFDLGNVLLRFSHERMCRQMAEVAGVDDETMRAALFDSGLELAYESGAIDTAEFYDRLCEALGRRPPLAELSQAASDIFELNVSIVPVITALRQAGYRLGLLSNTCAIHWEFYADGRYSLIPDAFETLALSYELHALKPQAEIYERAAELAGVAPREIFFTDDVPGHVAAAQAAGFDAAPYTTTPDLVHDLRARGVKLNY